MKRNVAGLRPKFGAQGFDNPFNNYMWAMQVAGGKLYAGTMDWRNLFDGAVADLVNTSTTTAALETNTAAPPRVTDEQLALATPPQTLSNYAFVPKGATGLLVNLNPEGSDLWRFDNGRAKATPESLDGFGDQYEYGVRNLVSNGDAVVVGTANGINLEGGWRLLQLGKSRIGGSTW